MGAQDTLYNVIIPQLDKCREVGGAGKDRGWSACCPAHDDKSPSFSVALCHDGKILMHCYSGCSIDEICYSLGVEPSDLFPEDSNWKREKRDNSIDEWVIEMGNRDMERGKALTEADKARYRQALTRINNNQPSPRPEPGIVQRNSVTVGERYSKRTAERLAIIQGDKV